MGWCFAKRKGSAEHSLQAVSLTRRGHHLAAMSLAGTKRAREEVYALPDDLEQPELIVDPLVLKHRAVLRNTRARLELQVRAKRLPRGAASRRHPRSCAAHFVARCSTVCYVSVALHFFFSRFF